MSELDERDTDCANPGLCCCFTFFNGNEVVNEGRFHTQLLVQTNSTEIAGTKTNEFNLEGPVGSCSRLGGEESR